MSTNRQRSLVELEQALAQWRSHRQGGRIPPWIRAQAVGLLGQHRASEIKAALGINHGMLKRWRAQCNGMMGTDHAVEPPDFVALPPQGPCQGEAPRERALSLTLSRHAGDGSAVSVAGTLSWDQWHQALRLLSAGEVLR
jgi:hypothetical protein